MIPWHRLIATATLATFAVGMLASTWAAEAEPSPVDRDDEYPPNATAAEKQEIDLMRTRDGMADPAMRKKLLAAYPFESLEDRLTFDAAGRKRVAKSFPTVGLDLDKWKWPISTDQVAKIPPATLATLLTEGRVNSEGHFERMRALASLHQVEVQKFVTNPGFGNLRLVSRRFYQTDEKPPTDWSEGDRGESVSLPKMGSFFNASEDKKGPTLPAVIALAHFHTSTAHEFTRPDTWGLVKDRKQVAGFQPHTLEFFPDGHARKRFDQQNPIKDKDGKITGYPLVERWAVRKLELIGLLMHESPVVYMNPDNKLPTMAAVKEAKTRELIEFESNGLRDLAAGKDVVVVDATTNQVRMVGAIRMAGACMKCHDGNRGDLLGAFTYDLVRDPAFIPAEK